MSDDTPEIAALKAAKARAELERDIAKAALDKAQSEQSLLIARAEAPAKEAKARIGTLEGGGIAGGVTAEAGSAAAEAALLAAWAIDAAAERIAAEIAGKLRGGLATNHFILFTGAGRPRLADWQMFEARRAAVAAGFLAAEREAAPGEEEGVLRLLLSAQAREHAMPGMTTTFGLVGALPAAGAVIDAAAKLGSFFQSEFKVAPAAAAGADDDLLALSLAGRLPQASYPARWPAGAETDAADAIEELLGDLLTAEAHARARLLVARAQSREAEAAAAESTEKDARAALEREAARHAAIADRAAAAIAQHDALIEALAAADASGSPLIARVIEQKTVARRLRGGALALMVQVTGAAGSTYTARNLWTFLGSMPFHVSGGAVARYVAMEANGIIRAAGQVPVHGGHHAVHAVAERFQRRF